jgi:hypothetical protein
MGIFKFYDVSEDVSDFIIRYKRGSDPTELGTLELTMSINKSL